MKNSYVIIGIILFIIVTAIVMSMDTSQSKRIAFQNQSVALNNENAAIENGDVNINSKGSKFTNKDINTGNTNVRLNNTKVSSERTDIDFEPFDNQNTNYNNQNTISDNQNGYYKDFNDFKNRKDRLQNAQNQINNQKSGLNSRKNEGRYIIKNIDWNTWKSEFINKILDDSMSITTLDNYGVGAWFYYSFTVIQDGSIRDVKVQSPYITEADKRRVAEMIKGYEYEDITVFPANSKRYSAKVDAVVLLGNSEKKSKPSDFNDIERIKINLPN